MLQLIVRGLFAHEFPVYCSFGLMADAYLYKSVFATNYAQENDVLVLRNSLQTQIDIYSNNTFVRRNN